MHVSNRPNEPMSSYRPHNPGHDYYDAGTYLITLVVTERCPLLGTLCDDIHHPSVALTPTGRIIHEEWNRTETIQQAHGRNISTLCQVCMPDHWHGVITVGEHMDKSLGFITSICRKNPCRLTGNPSNHGSMLVRAAVCSYLSLGNSTA